MSALAETVAADLELPASRVAAALALLDDGATIPFIARYRKERTGSLDEVQLRDIAARAATVKDLEDRRRTILKTIDEQGALTSALRKALEAARTKSELEDLYLPFRPKRKTKASVAIGRGLEPLSERILEQGPGSPQREARGFLGPEVKTTDDALAGARDIVVERIHERADIRARARESYSRHGRLRVTAVKKKVKELGRTPYESYYDHEEPVSRIASHRYLAIRRGEEEGVLRAKIEVDTERLGATVERMMGLRPQSPWADELRQAVHDALGKRLGPSIETEVRAEIKARADEVAVEIFADNLRHLLLAAPFGPRSVLGIDPGFRTGCKCAALSPTGELLDYKTIYPFAKGSGAEAGAKDAVVALVRRHGSDAVAIGNGTGGRETERLVRAALKEASMADVLVVSVSEAGASVYSASDVAREEMPDVDLTVRGAVSIARRLQDPLAELVKVDPQSIGVGQYQHDVSERLLRERLDQVVESCVNQVGVDLNTASAPLLTHVSGIGPTLAKNIIAQRGDKGRFQSRQALLKVKGLGPKAFELAAGFLRVPGSAQPLDATAVHPERYDLVRRIAKDLGVGLPELKGEVVQRIDATRYIGEEVGRPTMELILEELAKPGRDPRDTFEAPAFRDDVETLEDLRDGMILEGVVTNVVAFGAFVDIGVHQDGLIHISQLADRRIAEPREVVRVGDRVKVRVQSVDLERRRISLSRRDLPK